MFFEVIEEALENPETACFFNREVLNRFWNFGGVRYSDLIIHCRKVFYRLVPSRYLRVLWGEKIGYGDGLRHPSQHSCIQSSLPTKQVDNECLRVWVF